MDISAESSQENPDHQPMVFSDEPKSPVMEQKSGAYTSNSSYVPDSPAMNQDSTSNGGEDAEKKLGPKNHGAAGSTWNNKKAAEEYDRAMNALTDRGWNMDKFGELLDDEKVVKDEGEGRMS